MNFPYYDKEGIPTTVKKTRSAKSFLLILAMSISSRTTTLSEIKSDIHVTRNRWKDRDISPERTVVWTEPLHNSHKPSKKVPVVYYLSRNGQLQHPHFIQLPLSSPHGLYLQDVINRLNSLRGKGMASMYSWSCKRSYKNGYVWQDLAENDYVHPANGNEYVLKGSEILDDTMLQSSISKNMVPETVKHGGGEEEEEGFVADVRRRRHQSWSSFDLNEYKTESTGEASMQRASTQMDEKQRCRGGNTIIFEDEDENEDEKTTELKKDEISPPPLDSSPETLETLMKADNRIRKSQPSKVIEESTLLICYGQPSKVNEESTLPVPHSQPSKVNKESMLPVSQINGKSKSTPLLMQLFSCGAMSFKDCGPGRGDGFNLISHYNRRLPRGVDPGSNLMEKEAGNITSGASKSEGRRKVVVVEDKEYFSGSIVETKKSEFPYLRGSSSYNADR
ncbi:hypothetical protein Leryth_020256 [Lithospermum erythrorhizon]|nr:hypothetical protein Leryth_020256 [Lithospermum erythrorhizon]